MKPCVHEPTLEEIQTATYDYVREEYADNPAWLLDIPGVYDLVAAYVEDEVILKLQYDYETNNTKED